MKTTYLKKSKEEIQKDIDHINAINVIRYAKQIDEIYGTDNYKEGIEKYWTLKSKDEDETL